MDAMKNEPCPNCGSATAVWRKRRVQDFLFNWLRYFTDLLAGKALAAPRAFDRRGYSSGQGLSDHYYADAYEVATEVGEMDNGLRTADRFWRCPACGRHGEVYT
jgi:hypothetical protein